jgi:hypothetical protein
MFIEDPEEFVAVPLGTDRAPGEQGALPKFYRSERPLD